MLRVQRNRKRDFIELNGMWEFMADPDDTGENRGMHRGFYTDQQIAVPGSWNEQLQEAGYFNYSGTVFLQKRVYVPEHFKNKAMVLRIGSAEFFATVWVNGKPVGENDQLFLPFDCVVDDDADTAGTEILVVVKVNNLLKPDSITQQVSQPDYLNEGRYRDEIYPAVRFDFFPYGGIHRPVYLSALPHNRIQLVKVDTFLVSDSQAKLAFNVERVLEHKNDSNIQFELDGHSLTFQQNSDSSFETLIDIKKFPLWSPSSPNLHFLKVMLVDENQALIDEYSLKIGIREVKIKNHQLFINGKPEYMRGFGKHEDSPIHGKGLNLPQIVKDFGLMKWIHANSFRTSHYPYAEEWLDYADKEGFLIISEIASINLDFRKVNQHTLSNHKNTINTQFARDYNHPCVIAWSLANEAGFLGEDEYFTNSPPYWQSLFEHANAVDPYRPKTMANVLYIGSDDPVFQYCDFVSINRYYGWYQEPGQLDRAFKGLANELDYIGKKYDKPILVSEFGADTIAGAHSTCDQLFTEEYQADFLTGYCKVIEASPYTIGEHVWNFADFRTAQHFRRAIFNLKGVFNRNREPKRSAFALKEMWSTEYKSRKE